MKLPTAVILALFCAACWQEAAVPESVLPSPPLDSLINSYRIPLEAPYSPVDSSELASIILDEETFDFGKIRRGRVVRHDFSFTNTGDKPLRIEATTPSCGCTIVSPPKTAIEPGERGRLRVSFDTTHQRGRQHKPVVITANTRPRQTTIYLTGTITD